MTRPRTLVAIDVLGGLGQFFHVKRLGRRCRGNEAAKCAPPNQVDARHIAHGEMVRCKSGSMDAPRIGVDGSFCRIWWAGLSTRGLPVLY